MYTLDILKIVFVAVLLGAASMGISEEDVWMRKADMPTARFGLSASVVDSKIYVIGGAQGLFGAYFSTVELYEPSMDTWTIKANMPTARCFLSTSVVNGKIYAIGGSPSSQSDSSIVEEYDPATDTWTRKADMPTRRTFLSTSVLDGNIYAIGGRMYPGGIVSAVETFNPETNTWTRKADMPTARASLSTCVLNGKIYAIGGKASDVDLSIVEEYDPETDTWSRKTNMPRATRAPSTTVLGNKFYAIGGGIPNMVFANVEEYDPVTDTWTTKADMPTARFLHSSVEVNGKIYAIGGSVEWWPQIPTSIIEEYTPPLIVDFNNDGIVDISDLLRLIESWGQDDPTVDIAPPCGDGVIDVLDLEVLMNHWQEEVIDPSLVAHWKLDETEGDTAHDSIEGNDGFGPHDLLWRPEDGKVGGALELDGIDDSIVTTFSLNPTQTSFSAFAWIKGGGPNQVALSQSDGVDWLLIDENGNFMTALRRGHYAPTLTSGYVITDGDWHHIGVIWDKSHRHLYADGIAVAGDTANIGYLSASNGNLCIGCGNEFDAGTFFSGLIDDIRIYSVALSAEEIAALAQ
jgi:N-acetylneuraminic acid mutarotase